MFLFDGPDTAKATLLLAHGAGAPMDSAAMNAITKALAQVDLRVARFEFGYMASRRTAAGRKPPPRAEKVMAEYLAAVDALKAKGPLVIGGKSMGGRVASLVADELLAAGKIAGLLCVGYPFHPVGKPEQLRTAHLAEPEDAGADRARNARSVRHPRGGRKLHAIEAHRDSLAGGRRS